MLAAVLAVRVGAAVPIKVARPAWAAPTTTSGPVQLTLPTPTGLHPAGTASLHLVDTSRPDPVAGPGHHRELMAGLLGALDPQRIGMFGWSKGATATALVMSEDQRVRAGLSFDGPMQPTVTADLDRPFMLMTAEYPRATQPSVAEFWSHLHGWRLNIQAEGAIHSSYTDGQVLIPQLAKAVGMSNEELRGWIGTLDPARAVRIQQACDEGGEVGNNASYQRPHLPERTRLSSAWPGPPWRTPPACSSTPGTRPRRRHPCCCWSPACRPCRRSARGRCRRARRDGSSRPSYAA